MYKYRCCGLKILSNVEQRLLMLPQEECINEKNKVDITFFYKDEKFVLSNNFLKKDVQAASFDSEIFPDVYSIGEKNYVIAFKEIGVFEIFFDKNITYVNAYADSTYLSQVCNIFCHDLIAFILLKSKILPLHAGCIQIKGKTVVILGESGTGKSTFLTSFLRYFDSYFVSDDITPLKIKNNIIYVRDSYPFLNLWDDSAASIVPEQMDEALVISDKIDKRNYFVGNFASFLEGWQKLDSIIILNRMNQDKDQIIKATNKATAFIQLLKSTSIGFLFNADDWKWTQNIYRHCIETIEVLTIDYNSDFYDLECIQKELYAYF